MRGLLINAAFMGLSTGFTQFDIKCLLLLLLFSAHFHTTTFGDILSILALPELLLQYLSMLFNNAYIFDEFIENLLILGVVF